MSYTTIKMDEIFSGATFYTKYGKIKVKVLSLLDGPDAIMWVAYTIDGESSVFTATRLEFTKDHVAKAKHKLEKGDIFTIGGKKGIFFIYLSDNNVTRIGDFFFASEFYTTVSHGADLDFYVNKLCATYDSIEKVGNIGNAISISI